MIFARFTPPRVPTIRCQRRLSTGPRADWACPICTFPASVKGPWANAQEARGCRNDVKSRRALGVFLEFRLIPVLLWSFTAVILGTALAFHETGILDWRWFLATLAIATLVQGFETHAVNEIYDWKSGTDRADVPRALSGGSKVLNRGLLTIRELWVVFAVSSALVLLLTLYLAPARSWAGMAFVVPGYVSGLVYTMP